MILAINTASDFEYDIQSELGFQGHQMICGYKRIGHVLVRVKNHTPDWDYFEEDIEAGVTAIINITIGNYNN